MEGRKEGRNQSPKARCGPQWGEGGGCPKTDDTGGKEGSNNVRQVGRREKERKEERDGKKRGMEGRKKGIQTCHPWIAHGQRYPMPWSESRAAAPKGQSPVGYRGEF